MNIWTNIFIIFMVHYFYTYIKILFNKKQREEHKHKRKRMNELRKIPMKSKKQQKEFLDLKYPKSKPFIWNRENIFDVVKKIVIFISTILLVRYLWQIYVGYYFNIIQLIILVIIIPICINYILKKFGLENDDIRIMFDWRNKVK